MNFKEWLLVESSGQVVLMKAVGMQGSDSIKKDGFQLQDRHRSVANYYKKYGDTDDSQMYGPGLYFGIIPPGQEPKEFAMKNCKDYADSWGEYIVLATIKEGSRGLITGFWPEHPMWKYRASKETYIYNQLEALGVSELLGYTKNNTHSNEDWGYKLYDKIDFWAHQHNTRQHVVVYNPAILQLIDQFECETGNKKNQATQNTQATQTTPQNTQATQTTSRNTQATKTNPGSSQLTPLQMKKAFDMISSDYERRRYGDLPLRNKNPKKDDDDDSLVGQGLEDEDIL